MKEKFNVTGMTCSACSSHVEKAVSKLEGVKNVSVNLLTNSMVVDFDSDKCNIPQIVNAVIKAGYGADPVNFDQQKKVAAQPAIRDNSAVVRLVVSLVFMVILMYVSMGAMVGLPQPSFLVGEQNAVSFAFVQLLLCIPVLYVNRSYFINGFRRLFSLAPNMDSLIAVGSTASLLYGIFAIFRMSYGLGHGNMQLVHQYYHDLYFESAAMILALVTLGKFFEGKSKKRTGDALAKLRNLVPAKAIVLQDGVEVLIDSDQISIGSLCVVKSGMSFPADGVVTEGHCFADESAISGESVPVEKTQNAKVIGGTVNQSGYVVVKVTTVGGDSVLAKIISLVEDAGASKAPIARLADKIAGVFVPIVMGIALVTFIVWISVGQTFEFALGCAISVLVISCPCALGLATPVAIMVSTGKGAENGILIKSGEALETLHSVKYVVLDKTGTITQGNPTVCDVIIADNADKNFLSIVAGVEQKSEHPLGSAVCSYAQQKGIQFSLPQTFSTLAGKGVVAQVGKVRVAIGNDALMQDEKVPSATYNEDVQKFSQQGKTPLIVAFDNKFAGIIAVRDTIKRTASQAVALLKKQGIEVVMLTGDNQIAANAIASEVGIETVFAGVLPDQKENKISQLMQKGKVAMVGDGINDAPALVRADVGIAIGSGSDIAVDSADIVLVKSDLLDVVTALRLSKRTITNIKQNLFWAFFYNSLGIPLAAGVLYMTSLAIKLNPMIAAAAMSLSSLFVVGNALRLKFFKPTKPLEQAEQIISESKDKALSDDAFPIQSQNEQLNGVANSSSQDLTATGKTGTLCDTMQCDVSKNSAQINSQITTVALSDSAQNNNTKTTDKKSKRRNNMKYLLKIDGMMCGHCTARVEKALKAVQGVQSVQVSLENKSAEVVADSTVTAQMLSQAVNAQDYTVTSVEAL